MKTAPKHDPSASTSTSDAWMLLCVSMTLYVVSQVVLARYSIVAGTAMGQVLFFLLPAVLYAKWKTHASLRESVRLCAVSRGITLRVALLAFAGSGAADLLDRAMHPVIARHFADWLPALQALLEILIPKTPPGLVGNLVVIGILAPVCEEILFRGAVQGTLEQRGPVRAITITALTFGLMHLNPFNFFGPVLFGVALGFVTWRTGSILPAILWHALNNTLAMLLLYFGGNSFSRPLWLDGGLAVLFGLLLWEFIRHTRRAAPQPAPLATAPALLRGGAVRWASVAGVTGAFLLLGCATCFGHARLGDDLLMPEYRTGDIVIYRRGFAFRPESLLVRDVVIYREGRGALRFSRILRAEGERLAVLGSGDGRPAVDIRRKDALGKVVWKFDPGEEVKQLMRRIQAGSPPPSKGGAK